LLSKHRIRRWTAEELREVLATPPLPLAAGSADAISEHALLLLPQLRLLHSQRQKTRNRIEALLNEMTAFGREHCDSQAHHDVGLLLSLPGLGCLIAANLFTEGADPLAQRDYYALRAHSGIAPVTRQSGKSKQIIMRRGCSERLRNAMYHLARCSVQHDPLSKLHYARLRQAGHKHGRALRGVADPARCLNCNAKKSATLRRKTSTESGALVDPACKLTVWHSHRATGCLPALAHFVAALKGTKRLTNGGESVFLASSERIPCISQGTPKFSRANLTLYAAYNA
jgi:hypothetical protein